MESTISSPSGLLSPAFILLMEQMTRTSVPLSPCVGSLTFLTHSFTSHKSVFPCHAQVQQMQRRTWYSSVLAPFPKAHTSLSAPSLSPQTCPQTGWTCRTAEVYQKKKKIVLVALRFLLFLSFGNANIKSQLTTFPMRPQLIMSWVSNSKVVSCW